MNGNAADVVVVSGHFARAQKNPYIAFEYNDSHLLTAVKKLTGRDVVWNQSFQLKPLREPNELFAQAFAKSLLQDQFIGETGVVNLKDLGLGQNRVELALVDKAGLDQGKVVLDIHIRADNNIRQGRGEEEDEESSGGSK